MINIRPLETGDQSAKRRILARGQTPLKIAKPKKIRVPSAKQSPLIAAILSRPPV